MPVFKYQSVEEMGGPPRYESGSREHVAALRRLWRCATLLARRKYRPGVRRYRAIDDPGRRRPDS